MDTNTGLVILGTAIGSAKIVEKILGPTAEYVGDGLKNWTEKRVENIARIFNKAHKKLGNRIDLPGAVPPKVLKHILDEGSFAEDELAAEYFGGVLASSRTGIARDDRGAAFVDLVGRLTSYQLRSHYIFYTIFKNLFNGTNFTVTSDDMISKLQIYIPRTVYEEGMDFTSDEVVDNIVFHALFGLSKEQLIAEDFAAGNVDLMKKAFRSATEPGIVVSPSPLGAELFLWAHGLGTTHPSKFLLSDVLIEADSDISIPDGSFPTCEI